MRTLDKILEIIKILINSWQLVVITIFLFIRKDLGLLLSNTSSTIRNLNDIKYKDVSLTFEKRRVMSEKLQSINEQIIKNTTKREISTKIQVISEKIITTEFKESFDEFVRIFTSADSCVINSSSKDARKLEKMSELGLILVRSEKKDNFFRRVYYEYEVTEIGRIIKKLYENSANPDLTYMQ